MADGILRRNSVVGIEEEVTPGTYLAPQAATSYIQPTVDGFSLTPARELLQRGLLTGSIGVEKPLLGIKSCAVSLTTEFRASGTEGGAPDFDKLIDGALGNVRTTVSQTTTTSNTSTQLNFGSNEEDNYAVGDIVLVEQAGEFEMRPISAIGSGFVTLAFALTGGAPSDGAVVSALRTYYPANTSHPSLSASVYWANEIRQAASGCLVESMNLTNFTPGAIANLEFGLQGLTYEDEANGTAPHTPSFDSVTPPLILNACVWYDGVLTPVSNVSISLANTISNKRTTCSPNGNAENFVSAREITGSLNPYKDDTTTGFFDDWNDGTNFSLFLYAYNPSSTPGEIVLGSAVGIWLPQCVATEFQTVDVDGILVDQISFSAHRGTTGTSDEMFMTFV